MGSQETVNSPFALQANNSQINSDLTRAGLIQTLTELEESCEVQTPQPDFWQSVHFYCTSARATNG